MLGMFSGFASVKVGDSLGYQQQQRSREAVTSALIATTTLGECSYLVRRCYTHFIWANWSGYVMSFFTFSVMLCGLCRTTSVGVISQKFFLNVFFGELISALPNKVAVVLYVWKCNVLFFTLDALNVLRWPLVCDMVLQLEVCKCSNGCLFVSAGRVCDRHNTWQGKSQR